MSIKTFFEKVESDFAKLFGKVPAIEQTAQSTISFIAPFVESIIGFAEPAIAPLVTGVINVVESDLATVSTVVKQGTAIAGSTVASTVSTALNAVQTNLSGLLQVAEVKNSAKIAEITSAVTLVTGEVNALLARLTTPAPAPAMPAANVTGK